MWGNAFPAPAHSHSLAKSWGNRRHGATATDVSVSDHHKQASLPLARSRLETNHHSDRAAECMQTANMCYVNDIMY
jgi:hypothetical protein